MTHLTWSDDLGKRIRTGDWPDQAIGTVTKVNEAIVDGRWEAADQLIDYFMEEAKVVQVMMDFVPAVAVHRCSFLYPRRLL